MNTDTTRFRWFPKIFALDESGFSVGWVNNFNEFKAMLYQLRYVQTSLIIPTPMPITDETLCVFQLIAKFKDVQDSQDEHERLVTNLLDWIAMKIKQLRDRRFPNSVDGIQRELATFKEYLNVEKPPKYRERGLIEANYFKIQAKLTANGQRSWIPKEGLLVNDIEKAWAMLERSEYERSMALRDELLRYFTQ